MLMVTLYLNAENYYNWMPIILDEGVVVDGGVAADGGRGQVAEELVVSVAVAIGAAVAGRGDEGEQPDVGEVEVARGPKLHRI